MGVEEGDSHDGATDAGGDPAEAVGRIDGGAEADDDVGEAAD